MKVFSISFLALASAMSLHGVAQAQTFDGPSVGAQGGWVENDLKDTETELGVITIDASRDSPTFGGFIGYDKTIGNFVLGAEAGINLGTSDTVSGGSLSGPVTIDPKWSYDLTARAGYLVTPKTLVYARGGYANDRVRITDDALTGPVIATENREGWLIGGGVEREIIPQVSARVEYRYSGLGEDEGTFDRHQTLLGVTYRF